MTRRGSISPHSVPHRRHLRSFSFSIGDLFPLRPLPLTVPTPGVPSHTTGTTATWSALLPCYTTTTNYVTTAIPLARFFVSRAASSSLGPGATASLSSSSSPCPRHVSVCSFVRSFTEGVVCSLSLTHYTTTVTITTPAHRQTEPLPLYLRSGSVRAFFPHGPGSTST